MLLSDVTSAMACSPPSSASDESCLHFVAIAEMANRPKNIRIHLALARVRFYPLRFNSSGNFCDGGAICSRGAPHPNPHAKLTSPIFALATLTRGHGPYASRLGPACGTPLLPVLSRPPRSRHDNPQAL